MTSTIIINPLIVLFEQIDESSHLYDLPDSRPDNVVDVPNIFVVECWVEVPNSYTAKLYAIAPLTSLQSSDAVVEDVLVPLKVAGAGRLQDSTSGALS